MRGRIARFMVETAGVAAIEFALLAPVLLTLVLAGIDLSRVLAERQALAHVLRSGGQFAMTDAGAAVVLSAMQAASAGPFTLAGGSATSVALGASRFCACPSALAVAVGCGTICTGSQPTYIFYRLTATKPYHGILFKQFALDAALQVQVR